MKPAKVVWKFPLYFFRRQDGSGSDWVDIVMPIGANVVACQAQGQVITLWAECSPEGAPRRTRRFKVYGTGHPLDETIVHSYIDTVQLEGGALVMHVYEVFPQ